MFNRRHFILAGTSVLASASAPSALASAVNSAFTSNADSQHGSNPNLDNSLRGHFSARVNERFYARNANASGLLKLEHVIEGYSDDNVEQFTLMFKSDAPLVDDIYTVTHLSTLQSDTMRIDSSEANKGRYVALYNVVK